MKMYTMRGTVTSAVRENCCEHNFYTPESFSIWRPRQLFFIVFSRSHMPARSPIHDPEIA